MIIEVVPNDVASSNRLLLGMEDPNRHSRRAFLPVDHLTSVAVEAAEVPLNRLAFSRHSGPMRDEGTGLRLAVGLVDAEIYIHRHWVEEGDVIALALSPKERSE